MRRESYKPQATSLEVGEAPKAEDGRWSRLPRRKKGDLRRQPMGRLKLLWFSRARFNVVGLECLIYSETGRN